MEIYTITAESLPDYDEWGLDSYWSCDDWRAWHGKLKSKYGQEKANQIWSQAWDNQSIDEHNYSWCKYDSNFNAFLKKENITGASHILANVFVSAENVIENVSDAADKSGKAASNTASVLKIALPIAVVAFIILVFYLIYKKYITK